jgi:hypothetical protein
MSLFNARDKQLVDKNPYLRLPEESSDPNANILDPLLFQSILHRTIDEEKSELPAGNRTRNNECRWRIQNLLGNVNEETWTGMCKAAVKGMTATIHNAQPNGTWVPCEYESRIAQNAKTQESFLEVVVRFVDTSNAAELAYQDGRPVVSVTVQSPAIDSKTLDNLSQRSTDPEIKAALLMLTQLVAKQQTSAEDLPAKPVRKVEEDARLPVAAKKKAEPSAPNLERAALDALQGLPTLKREE